MVLRFVKICCEREPVIVTSCVIGGIGFLLPLISPVRQAKDGTYLERLEARRAAYQPTEDASPGARSVRSYMRSSWGVL
ncbi:hypothetical protein KFE25_010246 [Diacronema lutheri]|uniref:Uncharacterized protein n=1 Tax=Diacronema lutheri TaxID=2081491 RepID=A0A8J5XI81_DIALT|nr:hypothetical protein KFE25_010246 [Diacronema lutheri]